MLDFLSWGHLLVIALAALFIFGPDRLPTLAQDAARGVRRAREAVAAVRGQLQDTVGEDLAELRDLDLRRYHPRTFLRDQLFGDDDPVPAAPPAPPRTVDRSTPPPFDPDAT